MMHFVKKRTKKGGGGTGSSCDDWTSAAAWRIFTAIERHARVRGSAHATVSDIAPSDLKASPPSSLGRANQVDRLDTFYFAETLKYAYLLALPRPPDLAPQGASGSRDEWDAATALRGGWVLTTEAHFMRVSDLSPSLLGGPPLAPLIRGDVVV